MRISFQALITGVFYLFAFSFVGYIYIAKHTLSLQDEQYRRFVEQIQYRTATLIEQKKEQNVLLGYSLSLNRELKQALLGYSDWSVQLSDTISSIESFTSLSDVWVGVVDKFGNVMYQSWSDNADNMFKYLYHDYNIAHNPHIVSETIAWRCNIASRVIVPVYIDTKPIGIVVSVVLFDHISTQLHIQGYDNIILLDEHTHADKSVIVDRLGKYIIAKNNPNIYQEFAHIDLEALLHRKDYVIDETQHRLFSKYVIVDEKKKRLGYILFSYPLDKIDLSSVTQIRTTLFSILGMIMLSLIAAGYYFYTIRYKKFIQAQRDLLKTQVNERTKTLQYLATHDTLTALPNRNQMEEILESCILNAQESPDSIYVLFLDLDRFKEINDTYGHSIGDALLKQVSQRIGVLLYSEDRFGRVGGDEFVIYLRNMTQIQLVERLEHIRHAMQKSFVIEDLELFVTCSIGVSHFPSNGVDAKQLLREADTAMYEAKAKGKNQYVFYERRMTDKILQRQELGRDLRHALLHEEFRVYYQPKIDVVNGKLLGFEGLVRWQHPTKGLLSPAAFIGLAEEIGLIIQIDEYVRQRAFSQIVAWKKMGLQTGRISLNISTKELESKAFFDRVTALISHIGIDVKDVEFEVLENQIMHNQNQIVSVLKKMRQFGISTTIDDFGTGYSSLSYLQKLPVDRLKIDQSFIRNLGQEESSLEIVRTIIGLSRTLGLEVIAEGVESQYHVDILLKEGCSHIQGYYFSKPLSASECITFLRNMHT